MDHLVRSYCAGEGEAEVAEGQRKKDGCTVIVKCKFTGEDLITRLRENRREGEFTQPNTLLFSLSWIDKNVVHPTFAAKEDTVKPNRAVHKVWASYRVVSYHYHIFLNDFFAV